MQTLNNFHFQVSGNESGPKVVFLHGLLGSVSNWRKIITKFQNTYHMLTFDQRGHGRSFQPTQGYAPEDYAKDLLFIIDQLGWNKVFLVGHSMGARNALEFTNLFPDRLRALILEDLPVTSILRNASRTEQMIATTPVPFESRRAAKEYFLNDFVQLYKNSSQVEMLGQFFYANIQETPQGQAVWRFYQPGILETIRLGRERNWRPLISSLKTPTLMIRGANSDDISAEDLQELVDSNPLISGIEIPDAGHWVHYDQPEAFCKSLENFVQSVGILT